MLSTRFVLPLALIFGSAFCPIETPAQAHSPQAAPPAKPVYTAEESAVIAKLKTLRAVPDTERGSATKQIAAQIAALPDAGHERQSRTLHA